MTGWPASTPRLLDRTPRAGGGGRATPLRQSAMRPRARWRTG